ncbi:MAG TPA: hypothetical protein VGH90_02275 [Chthoniobacteraceae bacterium]|jgi:hypothetical protein
MKARHVCIFLAVAFASCKSHTPALELTIERTLPEDGRAANLQALPSISLQVTNRGPKRVEFSGAAFLSGMTLEIRDSAGRLIPLNERGERLKQRGSMMAYHKFPQQLRKGEQTAFALDLADFTDASTDRPETVRAVWTLNVWTKFDADRVPIEDSVRSITLTSNPLRLKTH